MSIIRVQTGKMDNKNARAKYQVMNHTGFGEVVIIQEGVKRVSPDQLTTMTLQDAMNLHKKGLAVIVA